jgi:hypothetical protein
MADMLSAAAEFDDVPPRDIAAGLLQPRAKKIWRAVEAAAHPILV